MSNFLFDVVSNLALLAATLLVCGLYNRLTAGPAVNGAYVFAALAIAALALDAALTFLVFADAQNRYGQFSKPAAFCQRAGAYGFSIVAGFAWQSIARRKSATRMRADKALVIRTSPYSESHLHM